MKAVILLAGKGRRFQTKYKNAHKALTVFNGKTLLSYLLENLCRAGIKDVYPVVGFKKGEIIKELNAYNDRLNIYPIINIKYNTTNNLYSLYLTKNVVKNDDFIIINGDMVFDYHILSKIKNTKESNICVDDKDYGYEIDSPRVIIENNIIKELGRHIHIPQANGYAIGIYKIGKELNTIFFEETKKLLDINNQDGFHYPLNNLFNKYKIKPCIINDYIWTDLDEPSDIEKCKKYLKILEDKMGKFENKNILITGTSKGIGNKLAYYFAEEGANVYAVSRKKVTYNNKAIFPIVCDINKTDKLLNILKNRKIIIDILINNAGIICYKNLFDVTKEDIEGVFLTNTISTLLLSQKIAKEMIANKVKGVIVNTISFAAKIPSVGSGVYAASKAALESLTKTMAAEWAPYGIRVNGYSPGVIKTEMTEKAIKSNKKNMLANIVLNKFGNTDDVVKAVSFLASEDSSYLTGINLDVSGGKMIVQNANIAWKDYKNGK